MIVIGMTGPIGHGKSTFAKALKKLEPSSIHFESSLVVAEVADALHAVLTTVPDPYSVAALNNWLRALPAILLETVHTRCDFDQIKLTKEEIEQHPAEYQKLIMHVENLQRNPDLVRHQINHDNKETYRAFLQFLGGHLIQKVDKGIWYKEIVRRVYEASSHGYKLCIVGGLRFPLDAMLLREAGGIIVKVYRPGHLQNDMLDPTERERDDIQVDCTVMSNAGIEEVNHCAAVILDDIRKNQLKPLYQTINFRATASPDSAPAPVRTPSA